MDIKQELMQILINSLDSFDIEINKKNIIISKEQDYYSTNIALTLAKDFHKKPEEIANIIKNNITDERIEKIDIIYPGTMNIYLTRSYILSRITSIIEKNINYGKNNIGNKRKIIIRFNKENIEESLTIKDIKNLIYIDNISRIFKYNSYEIIKEYYFTSSQIESLSIETKKEYLDICMQENTLKDTIARQIAYNIYKFYTDTKKDSSIDFFKKEVIEQVIDIQKKQLDKYRINFDIYSNEDTLYSSGTIDNIINRLNKTGYTYLNEDKLWLKTTIHNDTIDRILITSDGSYTDLIYNIAYYIDKYNHNYDGIINIIQKDNDITPVISSLKILGEDIQKLVIKEEKQTKIDNTILNYDTNLIRYYLTDEQAGYDTISEQTNDNPMYNIELANRLIYSLLKQRKITKENNFSTISEPLAYIILDKLQDFEIIVKKSCLKEYPQLICDYLLDLSNLFHEYYQKNKIITEDDKYTNERLNLLLSIKIVINNALDLIGIIPREN